MTSPEDAAPAPACCAAPEDAARRVVQPDKARLLARLSRIEGQVRGVTRMIEEDRYCIDVLTQLAAAKSALNGVAMQLLENHARGCVTRAAHDGDGEAAMDELMKVLRRLDGKAFD
ncbi:metal-sensitive transcriptional regulator [Verticiella sediminum]|uniref:Metal-sensitive transcriptional regulator n=1 Tax=Verticiella sediminum TaxID=1247510 RepID=A0A556AYL2_9BURK|nr:metal-sensitive transcriptional regulator [Verticiella sediminum]TSH97986.1 metal-sensitive transcriptional regulator [Verticiella sediminum]